MKYVTKSMNTEFRAIMDRLTAGNKVAISKICKNGKPGKPHPYDRHGSEKTVEDVIARLKRLNPGIEYVAA